VALAAASDEADPAFDAIQPGVGPAEEARRDADRGAEEHRYGDHIAEHDQPREPVGAADTGIPDISRVDLFD
jgi:hypothetical protein